MIPIRLTLHQFLSYQSAILDLTGIHTACICGPNGAGKSALLEALTWGIWGQSRAAADDDLIHKGTTETQVEVIYQSREQIYRILRTRTLAGASSLEWQLQTGSGWRSLTCKGLRATQQAIQAQLRLDYETFINSAYLRQGRADEFTLKRPGERKQILAEILKLGQYEQLAETCRNVARSAKGQADLLQEQSQRLVAQQAEIDQIEAERQSLQARQAQLQTEQEQDQHLLEDLRARLAIRQGLQTQHQQLTEQLTSLTTALQGTEQQWRNQRQQLQELEALIAREPVIVAGCRQQEALLQQDHQLTLQFQQQQALQQERQQLQDQLAQIQQGRLEAMQALQRQLGVLQAQQQADERLLQESARIEAAWLTYRQAGRSLSECEQRQALALPLLEKQRQGWDQLKRQRAQLSARQEFLHHQVRQLHHQQQQLQQVQLAVVAIEDELADREQRRTYQQQLMAKAQERKLFVHQLQERQRELQRQWQALEEKRYWLKAHDSPDPAQHLLQACPLCDQALSPQLRVLVVDKHQKQQSELQDQILVIREQLAVADREIELMEQEALSLAQELKHLDSALQAQGRLQNQLETGQHQISQLQSWQAEIEHLHQTLEQESYGKEIRAQLDQIDADLSTIGYSDKDHALARAELERWRWVESKRSDLQKAQQRQQRLQQEIDKLQSQIQADRQTDASDGSQELAERLQAIDATLKAMPYTVEHHQTIRWQLRQAQAWLLQRDALLQARQQLPGLQAQCDTLIRSLQQQRQTFTQQTRQLESLHKQLAHLAPVTDAQLKALVTGIEQRRQQQDQILSRLGAVEQRLHHLAQLESEQAELGQQLQHTRRHYQVHQELATAFGRNGIPALIIENVLPELEAEANQILSKLTANQLHIQFITQRSGRRSAKLIDTLDIVIADPQGTRPYETYSGGEAFRINFAIRLALSRLLAQRAGARLQTLMIDEGFGTQDQTGRQQLVAAINAVASDFACILVITHIPSLRDAFPTRIEVERTPQGSRLSVQG